MKPETTRRDFLRGGTLVATGGYVLYLHYPSFVNPLRKLFPSPSGGSVVLGHLRSFGPESHANIYAWTKELGKTFYGARKLEEALETTIHLN